MSSQPVILYHGVNDAHEFWQSEDSKIVILHCHHEDGWSAHRDFKFQCAAGNAEAAASELGFPIQFSQERVFQKDENGEFVLFETNAGILSRFYFLLGRLDTLQGPFVGVPMVSGDRPFAIRREVLSNIVKGLKRVQFELLPNGRLRISGKTEYGGRHVSKLVNQSVPWEKYTYNRSTFSSPLMQEIEKWAEARRKSRKKPAGRGTTVLDKAGRARQKVEIKIRKVDEQIKRLKRKIDQIEIHRPHNPILAEKLDDDSDWDRRNYQRLYTERSKRKAISKTAARCAERYEPRKIRKAITIVEQISLFDSDPARETVRCHTVTESVWRPFAWKQFYAALQQCGIRVSVPYHKAKNRKNGPSSPRDYWRNMNYFGLMQRSSMIGRDLYSGAVLKERVAKYQAERKTYIGTLRKIQSLEMTIASLKEIRASHEEELDCLSGRPTQSEVQVLPAAA